MSDKKPKQQKYSFGKKRKIATLIDANMLRPT